MRTILFIFALLVTSSSVFAQKIYPSKNLDAYVGTWKYQQSDTIFRIILQRGQYISDTSSSDISNGLFGGYWLIVNGKTVEKYWTPLLESYSYSPRVRPRNLYIWTSNSGLFADDIDPNWLYVDFYDQRKKHFDGRGIMGGFIRLLSPDKIHWKLDEEKGLQLKRNADEAFENAKPIGFSVPTDVIMIKEE